jgi:hypothetical protein
MEFMVLEISRPGYRSVQDQTWVPEDWVKAVNYDGRFGKLTYDVSFDPADMPVAIRKAFNYKTPMTTSDCSFFDGTQATNF